MKMFYTAEEFENEVNESQKHKQHQSEEQQHQAEGLGQNLFIYVVQHLRACRGFVQRVRQERVVAGRLVCELAVLLHPLL